MQAEKEQTPQEKTSTANTTTTPNVAKPGLDFKVSQHVLHLDRGIMI